MYFHLRDQSWIAGGVRRGSGNYRPDPAPFQPITDPITAYGRWLAQNGRGRVRGECDRGTLGSMLPPSDVVDVTGGMGA